jgi:hypothetical protein
MKSGFKPLSSPVCKDPSLFIAVNLSKSPNKLSGTANLYFSGYCLLPFVCVLTKGVI